MKEGLLENELHSSLCRALQAAKRRRKKTHLLLLFYLFFLSLSFLQQFENGREKKEGKTSLLLCVLCNLHLITARPCFTIAAIVLWLRCLCVSEQKQVECKDWEGRMKGRGASYIGGEG